MAAGAGHAKYRGPNGWHLFPGQREVLRSGRASADGVGNDFVHPFEYDPGTNTWSAKSASFPDNQVNNMACGVLNNGGTDFIYCVGGSAGGQTTATARVFFYDPVADTMTSLTSADNWPGDAAGTILPGGFAVTGNKLYILGGFNINIASTNQIWQFDPTAAVGAKWTQIVNTPEGIIYAATTAIAGIIYVGGASDFSGGTVIDTTDSFSFNPATNSIGTIAPIPRATGETRALTFNFEMFVMGGGRVAPNPSNEVDVYNPYNNSWTVNLAIPAFMTARRNFPTDTDGMGISFGTGHFWVAGGYGSDGAPLSSMEIWCDEVPTPSEPPCPPCGTPTGTATATPTAPPLSPTPTPTLPPSPTPTPPNPSPTAPPTHRATPLPRLRPTPAPRP